MRDHQLTSRQIRQCPHLRERSLQQNQCQHQPITGSRRTGNWSWWWSESQQCSNLKVREMKTTTRRIPLSSASTDSCGGLKDWKVWRIEAQSGRRLVIVRIREAARSLPRFIWPALRNKSKERLRNRLIQRRALLLHSYFHHDLKVRESRINLWTRTWTAENNLLSQGAWPVTRA